jgi:uncharacterized hydrophobic protein (TIGR00341 family)
MALRIVEAHIADRHVDDAEALMREHTQNPLWSDARGGVPGRVIRAVVGTSRTGSLLDGLWRYQASDPDFRVLVLPVDAVLPRPKAAGKSEDHPRPGSAAAVSREEIYAKVSDASELSSDYVALVALSTVVAAIGMVTHNTAAVIGAMVVAPLLGPNMGLALGVTLAERDLVRTSVRATLIGVGLAFTVSLAMSLGLEVDPQAPELASRTWLGLGDVLLALAAGCAGTLAFTSGAPSYLIGVMVAVALLPPTVACGLLLGDGYVREAGSALLLVLVNITAVNLAAMATFVAKGMRPRTWWNAQRARRSVRWGLSGWLLLLAIFAGAVLLFSSP